VEQQKSPSCAT